jgi:hypothetical protein
MSATQRERRADARWIAVGASLAVHLGVVGLLLTYRPSGSQLDAGQAIVVELLSPQTPMRRPARRTKSLERPQPARTPSEEQRSAIGAPAGQPAQTNAQSTLPSQPSPAPIGGGRLSAALRQSGIGCANPDAARLTDSEREACRRRLTQGAASAPYVSAVPPEKREYYAALQESEAAMARDPMGGHGPQIVCGPAQKQRLGLKLGPCKLAAPLSPWIPEADVQGP